MSTADDVADDVNLLAPREMFDKALIGVVHQGGMRQALYSRTRTIELLIEEGASYEDAVEHYHFNVSGSIGLTYPVFLEDEPDDEEESGVDQPGFWEPS